LRHRRRRLPAEIDRVDGGRVTAERRREAGPKTTAPRAEGGPGGGAGAGPRASSLQVALARQILTLIRREGWEPGRRVPEQTLARSLDVSRSPVRGALGLLAERGLLRSEAGRGFVLARLPDDDAGLSAGLPPSREEGLYDALLADRANGRIAQEVSEAELMPRYDVSRGLVRKVFMRLAAEGLATRLRGHGWRFAESLDTEAAVSDSYRFRMIIECAALREPGYRLDPAAIAGLRRAHEAVLARGRPMVGGAEWFDINANFHESIVAGAQNRFLLQAARQQSSLRRMQEFVEYPSLPEDRIIQSCREHLAILDAIATGDLPWAEALLMRHLELAARKLEDADGGVAPASRVGRPGD
jgi:DNA-binding GntR family transcriptional regulator